MRTILNTPEGTRDRIFGECRDWRRVQSALTHLFRKRGYAEVITPEVEYYDLFVRSGSSIPQESMLKIIDRSGKICVLRPDCTTPIARVAATKLKDMVLPQRLYYNQVIYRSSTANAGWQGELPQCGIELIGATGLKADLEVIATAVDSLRACGLTGFHIEIGHAAIYKALASAMDISQEAAETIRSLIEGKSFAALGAYLGQFTDRPACAALRTLAYLFGGVEVLDAAAGLGSGEEDTIAYLRTLYEHLEAAGYGPYIRFDLGLVHQIDYYTGVVFRGYAEGAGREVLSGGRYDRLVETFGRPAPATGFAVYVDALAQCLPPAELPRPELVIHFEPERLREALAAVDAYPAGVCQLSPCRTLDKTRNMAREKGIPAILILDNDGERREEL